MDDENNQKQLTQEEVGELSRKKQGTWNVSSAF